MNLSWSARSTQAIEGIQELAAEHKLVVWDPQSQDAYLPGQITTGIDSLSDRTAAGLKNAEL
jgi:hypothetical protein